MRRLKIALYALSFVLLSSCGNYYEKKSGDGAIQLTADEKFAVDFDSVKILILDARCVFCHQQYSSYRSVFRQLQSIQDYVLTNRMPKTGGPLTDNQKAILTTWINNGAPEKKGVVTEPPKPTVLEPIWTSLSQNIFFPKCVICHNSQGQAKFLDLSSRSAVFENRDRKFSNGAKLIDFGKPNESYLIQVIEDSEEPMPPVASNISRLSPNEVTTIERWISLGLP